VITTSILGVMIFALIPWAVGLPVLRWHPGMQTDAARRTYRWVTFGIAFVVSLSMLVPALTLLRFIPLGAAIWLDIHRYRLSRTPAGGAEDLGFRRGTPRPYFRPPYWVTARPPTGSASSRATG